MLWATLARGLRSDVDRKIKTLMTNRSSAVGHALTEESEPEHQTLGESYTYTSIYSIFLNHKRSFQSLVDK